MTATTSCATTPDAACRRGRTAAVTVAGGAHTTEGSTLSKAKPKAVRCGGATASGGRCGNLTTTPGRCGRCSGSVTPAATTSAVQIPQSEPVVVSGRQDGIDLSGADVSTLRWTDTPSVHEGVFDNADASGARINGVFTHSSWRNADAPNSVFSGPHVASDFSGAKLTGAVLPDNDSGNFARADLSNATARRRSFDNADFSGAKFDGALLSRSDFSGAKLADAKGLDEATVRECFYDDATSFPDGYDPDANGWIRTSKDGEHRRRQQQMRSDAAAGAFDPYRYGG